MAEKAPPDEKDEAAAADADSSDQAGSSTQAEAATQGSDDRVSNGDIERLLDEAHETLEQAGDDAGGARPYSLNDLNGVTGGGGETGDIGLISDVELDLRIELGRTQMTLDEVLQLRGGSVVALDKLAGDPVDVYANGRLVARGEVLVMNDNFCIRVTELVEEDRR